MYSWIGFQTTFKIQLTVSSIVQQLCLPTSPENQTKNATTSETKLTNNVGNKEKIRVIPPVI